MNLFFSVHCYSYLGENRSPPPYISKWLSRSYLLMSSSLLAKQKMVFQSPRSLVPPTLNSPDGSLQKNTKNVRSPLNMQTYRNKKIVCLSPNGILLIPWEVVFYSEKKRNGDHTSMSWQSIIIRKWFKVLCKSREMELFEHI